jgi:basic amino acid/polyamine antiporter, APA family
MKAEAGSADAVGNRRDAGGSGRPSRAGPHPAPDLATAQVLGASLEAALALGLAPQALTTFADDPWDEIARVARTLDCAGLLLGLSDLRGPETTLARLDELLARVRSDVVVLRAPPGWHLERCRRVVVPYGGRADQERLRARVLASLARLADPEVEIVRLLPGGDRRRHLSSGRSVGSSAWSRGASSAGVHCVVERTDDPVAALTRRAADADLLLLGLPRHDADHHALGAFAAAVAAAAPPTCAVMLIHARG